MKILLMSLIVMLSVMTGPGQSRAMQGEEGKSMAEGKTMTRIATFAGGCFWCTEADFEKVPGVVNAISGYTGGHEENPSYKEVSSGKTGHLEAAQVHYDPSKIGELSIQRTPGGSLSIAGPNIAAPYFITMRRRNAWRKNRKKHWANPGGSTNPLSRRSYHSTNSMKQRSITRITISGIR
jgi:peptide methionine sulfoxide reductase msrA/msrB